MWSSPLAYIDPGTGGMILGGAGAALAWLALVLLFVRKLIARAARALGGLVWRHKGAFALGLAGSGIAGALFFFFQPGEPPTVNSPLKSTSARRVLLLGLDGADPRVLESLMSGGHLPNMSALARQGGFSPLAIPNPAQSPVVWAALATGQNPGRNGIFDFIERDPQKYLPKLALLEQHGAKYKYRIRAKAFWDVASAHGTQSVIIRWPMTFPPPAIKGRMLAGLGVPDLRGSLGRYTFFTDGEAKEGAEGGGVPVPLELEAGEVKTELGGPQVRGLTGVKTLTTPLHIKVDAERRRAELTLGGRTFTLEERAWSGLVEVTFESGLFSKYRGQVRLYLQSAASPFALLATSVEMHPAEPVARFTSPKEYGAELHRAIGSYHTLGMPEDTKAFGNGHMDEAGFLALCDKVEAERRAMLLHELTRFEGGVLAVVFDTLDRIQHMTAYTEDLPGSPMGRYLIDFDKFLGELTPKVPEGTALLIFSDHGFSEFRQSVDLNRWLVQTGELAIDEAGFKARKPGTNGELFKLVKWPKTRAYAVGFAGIYVNVEGREGQGVVPQEERQEVALRIKVALEALKDPLTGDPIVHRVYHREELYDGAAMEEAPDLVVGYRPGYRGSWQTAIGGLADEVVSPNDKKWQRDHIVDASFVDGSLLTSFPIEASRPHAYDLAPTVLSLLGLPVPAEMQGVPLHLPDARVERPAAGAAGTSHSGKGAPP